MDPHCWDDFSVTLCQPGLGDFIAHIAQPGTIVNIGP